MKIGVIGGNGVAATNRLCEMIMCRETAIDSYETLRDNIEELK